MNEELFGPGSTLKETFQRVLDENNNVIDEVDMDANLLKYLLESHAAHGGGTGPASLLLSQLGLQFPHVSQFDSS